jgi:DNA polymerase (family 10)
MMNLSYAENIADRWIGTLTSYCQRVEIAGSIRRKKPDVKDIEIVAIPVIEYTPDLFGNPSHPFNLLNHLLLQGEGTLYRFIKNGGRYKQIALPEGINLDLFIVLPPAQWGVIFTIRTGPSHYSKWLMTKKKYGGAMPSHMRVKDGALWTNDTVIDTQEEEDFFKSIGLDWIAPEARC